MRPQKPTKTKNNNLLSSNKRGRAKKNRPKDILGGEDIILNENGQRSYPVRAHLWQPAGQCKGQILFLPGFTEFCEKYAFFIRHLVDSGYRCLILDWPGQGRSGHLASHPLMVHIDDFSQHLDGLHEILEYTQFSQTSFFVIGHSMGGHLALRVTALYADFIKGTILLSPMIVPKGPPVWLTRMLAFFLKALGQHKHKLPFSSVKTLDQARKFQPDNALTHCAEGYERLYHIYDQFPELRRVGPTVGWVDAAFLSCKKTTLNSKWMRAVQTPVLSCLAGDERIVDLNKSKQMLGYIPHHQMVLYPEARHELLNELPDVVRAVYGEIDLFLKAHG